jgi:hypothetical protein
MFTQATAILRVASNDPASVKAAAKILGGRFTLNLGHKPFAAGDFVTWRTVKQHKASPHRMTVGGARDNTRTPVQVSRQRAALRLEAAPLAEDILVMLRRQFQD